MEHRDLACEEFWEESLARSRRRRAEQASSSAPDRVQRSAAVATAAVVLGTAPAAAAVGGKALGGGGGSTLDVKAQALADEVKSQTEPRVPSVAPPPAAPAPVAHAATSTKTSTPTTRPAARDRDEETQSDRKSPTNATVAASSVKSEDEAGGGVQELQQALGVPVDGDFGRRTELALRRWQRRHGLPVDGVAGAATREALDLGDGPALKREAEPRRSKGKAPSTKTGHRRGGGGGGVRALQAALGVGADGVFGPGTERALKRWQRRHGLTPDGVAGPQTRAKLGLGPGKVLKRKGRARRRGGGGGGGGSSVIARVISAANAIATKPYRYGGGHGSFSDSGYDCSGSVSYALHGGGLLSRPLDSSAFMSYGRPGPGRHITIYANPGHVYMVVNGRRFDTSARRQSGSRWSGSGRSSGGYVVRHPAGY